MKANYQSVNTYGELCKAVGQSIVECRFSGADVANVLTCEARAVLGEASCDNGEVRYGGKLYATFLYESADGKLRRAERGAEFFHKAEHPAIASAHAPYGSLTVLNVKTKREGGQIVAVCVVEGEFSVHGERRQVYLAGGEDLLVKKSSQAFCEEHRGIVAVEEEDEFECDGLQDVLLHTETATVTGARMGVGEVEITGEICLHFCGIRQDESLCSYERITPFKAQILLDLATPQTPCVGLARVRSAQVSLATDEERGKSKIALSYALEVEARLDEVKEITVGVDAYSVNVETELEMQKVGGRYALNTETVTERIHGSALLSAPISPDSTLLVAAFPKVIASVESSDTGEALQGVIEGKAIYKKADGGIECADVSLPFLFPISGGKAKGEREEIQLLECLVYGFSLRVRAGGETEAEATLKARYARYGVTDSSFISDVIEGDKKQEKTCAISVYVARRGDDLWTTAKRLSLTPEALEESNPALTFPLTGEERMVIYRQKRENLQK